jgi:hypothetical protein
MDHVLTLLFYPKLQFRGTADSGFDHFSTRLFFGFEPSQKATACSVKPSLPSLLLSSSWSLPADVLSPTALG